MKKLLRFFYVFMGAILFLGISGIAEEITLTTYYPAPYGKYEEIEVSRSDANTSLAVVNTGSSAAARYPGLNVTNYLGTAGGHPFIGQANYGGTKDTSLATPSGTLLGTLIYSGYNGTTNVQVARLGVTTTANFSATSSPVDYPADMYFAVGTNGTCCGITRMTIKGDTGNVGIGTTSPSTMLHVYGTSNVGLTLQRSDAANPVSISTNSNGPLLFYTGGSSRMIIDSSGNVGIGETNPAAKLDVNGNIKAVLNNITGPAMEFQPGASPNRGEIGFDVAEFFNTTEEVEIGDILVIDETQDVQLRKSSVPYDKTVAGIVSGSPAILFEGSQLEIAPQPGGFTNGSKPPLALCGRVPCKVSIENGPIERGDLLTTSSTPGHAMKATDRDLSFGAIVGKALESFSGGAEGEETGKIVVLVTLQ